MPRLLRASMLEVAGQRHVRYARLRGLSEMTVERSHILRNAWLPVITAIGMHIGELLGGALIIEYFQLAGCGALCGLCHYEPGLSGDSVLYPADGGDFCPL